MKRYGPILAILAALSITAATYARQDAPPSGTQTTPVISVPGSPPSVNPSLPNQPAMSVKEVESPAAPSHYTDQAIWALMVSFLLEYLKQKSWFAFLTPDSTARLKAQFGFVAALLTAAGIHFAVTGSVLDGGAAITISGLSVDALKDVLWQWTAQQAWYRQIVKGA